MKRALLAALGALSLAVAPAASAHPRLGAPNVNDPSKACPTGTIVVNVTYTVARDADIAADGHVWAFDQYTRTLQIVKTGSSTYCAATRDSGTWTSVGGVSPGGTGYLAPGVTGTFGGGFKTNVFSGRMRSGVRTSGSLGTFDYGCDTSGACSCPFDWQSYYFTSTSGLGLGRWSWTYYPVGYTSGSTQWWGSTYVGSYNDITTPPEPAAVQPAPTSVATT